MEYNNIYGIRFQFFKDMDTHLLLQQYSIMKGRFVAGIQLSMQYLIKKYKEKDTHFSLSSISL